MGLCIVSGSEPLKEDPSLDTIPPYDSYNESSQERVFLNETNDATDAKLKDFQIEKVLGKGSFGKVMLVTHKPTRELYAMKILRKDMIEKRNQKLHTQNERTILQNTNHPFLVKLHYAFQTQHKLYLIMDFMIGGIFIYVIHFFSQFIIGELFFHLRRAYRFPEERAKFYAAEIILALEYLHQNGVIYRDLKPENILLDQDGNVKLTDFGLSKVDMKEDEKTNTFCGTAEYLAPEILLGQGHNKLVDFWSLGALLYEMLSGAPPFYSKDKNQMFKQRLEKPIEMKQWFGQSAQNLLKGLLDNNPHSRLGAKGIDEIKNHEFFSEINWKALYDKQIAAPFKPKIFNSRDLRHFDEMFTKETPKDTPVKTVMGKQEIYEKFTYNKNLMDSHQEQQQKQENQFIDLNPNFSFQAIKK